MNYDFRLVLIIVILPLCFALPTAAQETEALQPGLAMNITTSPLPIYAEADSQSAQLAEIAPGTMLDVLEVDDRWAQVEYDGVVGWARYKPFTSSWLINLSAPVPMPRNNIQMAYDIESDRMILFGGAAGYDLYLDDTWAYEVSTNTWTQMNPEQSPPQGEGPIVYDSQSDRVILFHGINVSFSNTESEIWAYDYNTDTWTNMEPASGPPPSLGSRIVYDEESDRVILFGGFHPESYGADEDIFFDETWAYDYDTNTWTQMAPEVSPPGMGWPSMAYDAAADRVIMVPMAEGQLSEETWAYDYNTDTWESRQMVEGPGRRGYSAMVYAAGIGQMILFGNAEHVPKDDTWAYDFETNTWAELHPDTSPSRRGFHAMAYSSADELVVLFGGGESRDKPTNETWLYEPTVNAWTQVGP